MKSSNDKNSSTQGQPTLLLVDGHSLAFRAYYAFSKGKKGPLRTSSGIPTNICFGFLNSLLQVMEKENPQYLAIAFDKKEPTFRHEADVNYKANRQETPEDFLEDMSNLQRLLTLLNIPIVKISGYEADDILATLAEKGSQENYQVKIVSGDRDLFQLVNDRKNIKVLYLDNKAANINEFNENAVISKMGIKPNQVVDYKALCGDKSDNIPGVLGIGDKTAIKLLEEYNNLDNIYINLLQIKGSVKKKLEAGKESAIHSQYLAKLIDDIELPITLEDCQLNGFELNLVEPLLDKLELKVFKKEINKIYERLGGIIKEETQQLSLFDNNYTELKNDNISSIVQPRIIDTEEKLKELINILKKHINQEQPVAWDTETTSLKAQESLLVGISCCWGKNNNQIAYIPIHHSQGNQLDREIILSELRPILENKLYPKVLQNAKFDRLIFWENDINLTGVVFDTMLASYVINPETTHNLTDLSERYLSGIRAKSYKELNLNKGQNIGNLDIETVTEYAGIDAYSTFLLVDKLQAILSQNSDLKKIFQEIELPLEFVLAEMEYIGIKIDIAYLNNLSEKLAQQLKEIERKTYEKVGKTFNMSSPQQLSEILFDELNLDKRKTRKTKTGYSTDRTTLEKLQGDHPIIDYLLEHRTLSKLKSTYADTLPLLVNKKTGRIHTDFNQAVTTTGRLSSSNPNLQNIPIRTEFSRQIREAFIPKDDYLLVSADYSQIELRILAHLSQEQVLIDAYKNNEDVHSVTAKILLEKDSITAEERRLGKIINFGVIYGMGAQKFAKSSGIHANTARQFIDKYQQKYSKVFDYLETLKKEAISKGFVTTIMGRRRYFNFDSSNLQKLKESSLEKIDLELIKYSYSDAQLLRAAANAPIQGSSADIIKIAMVKLSKILKQYQTNLLLQVHDELVFEVALDEWQELKTIIKNTMENVLDLDVPLIVDINAGKNWMEAK